MPSASKPLQAFDNVGFVYGNLRAGAGFGNATARGFAYHFLSGE